MNREPYRFTLVYNPAGPHRAFERGVSPIGTGGLQKFTVDLQPGELPMTEVWAPDPETAIAIAQREHGVIPAGPAPHNSGISPPAFTPVTRVSA